MAMGQGCEGRQMSMGQEWEARQMATFQEWEVRQMATFQGWDAPQMATFQGLVAPQMPMCQGWDGPQMPVVSNAMQSKEYNAGRGQMQKRSLQQTDTHLEKMKISRIASGDEMLPFMPAELYASTPATALLKDLNAVHDADTETCLKFQNDVLMHHITKENTQESYWTSSLMKLMMSSMQKSIIGVLAFRLHIDVWMAMPSDRQLRQETDKTRKRFLSLALNQPNLLEGLGACGFSSAEQTSESKALYKEFVWNGAYAAMRAYRVAASANNKRFHCPQLLHKYLKRLFTHTNRHEDISTNLEFVDVTTQSLPFSQAEFETRLENVLFFFPFTNMQYDTSIMHDLFLYTHTKSTEQTLQPMNTKITKNGFKRLKQTYQFFRENFEARKISVVLS